MSRTMMETFKVPDLGGLPPSTAVTRRVLCSLCFSRSKVFCKTKNGILSSPLSRICTLKYSLWLNLYIRTVLETTSGSRASGNWKYFPGRVDSGISSVFSSS
uniref:Uncharacterized protein n=1 Tax=Sphaeramia orbicularis TaxID=375764 RepID=A0A672YLY9_9TELE